MGELSRDRVMREIVIRGPVERVFAALTDPTCFPSWGPERIEGRIVAGERPILDFGPQGGGRAAIFVVDVKPPSYFAFRWAQGATDPVVLLADPLQVPNTLVEFHVEPVEGGTRVRVVESGIASLPGMPGLDPDAALEQMGQGWQLMLGGLERSMSTGDDALVDRVENQVSLPSPRDRVYQALIHPEQWWAERVEGSLRSGELAVMDHGQFGRYRIFVERAQEPEYLAFRKIQGEPARWLDDPRTGPSTLVEFQVELDGNGSRVRQSESGFLALPAEGARAHLLRAQRGWDIVLHLLEMHLAKA